MDLLILLGYVATGIVATRYFRPWLMDSVCDCSLRNHKHHFSCDGRTAGAVVSFLFWSWPLFPLFFVFRWMVSRETPLEKLAAKNAELEKMEREVKRLEKELRL